MGSIEASIWRWVHGAIEALEALEAMEFPLKLQEEGEATAMEALEASIEASRRRRRSGHGSL